MRLAIAAAVFAVLTATPAMALMAPNYERLTELEAILDDGRINDALESEPIDRIEFISQDLFRVSAGKCHINVTLIDANIKHEGGWAGPREFIVQPGEVLCKD